MSTCPYCGHENTPGVDDCAECHQPLTDQHLADPLGPVEQGLLRDRVDAVSMHAPRTVAPDTPVRDVLATMSAEAVGCVLVGDETTLAGIFSERDALLRLGPDAAALGDRPVSEYMTASPECLQKTAKIAFAMQRMDLGGYRHVPICDANGRPEGVISIRDILRYLTDRLADAARS